MELNVVSPIPLIWSFEGRKSVTKVWHMRMYLRWTKTRERMLACTAYLNMIKRNCSSHWQYSFFLVYSILNSLHANLCWGNKIENNVVEILWWKLKTYLIYIVHSMAIDFMVTQGARPSATMALTYSSLGTRRNNMSLLKPGVSSILISTILSFLYI